MGAGTRRNCWFIEKFPNRNDSGISYLLGNVSKTLVTNSLIRSSFLLCLFVRYPVPFPCQISSLLLAFSTSINKMPCVDVETDWYPGPIIHGFQPQGR